MVCIESDNLSEAWARAFIQAREHHGDVSLSITITGVDVENIPERDEIRGALQRALHDSDGPPIRTVANTIA